MTKALLIKTTGELEVTNLPEENAYDRLNELCGGWLDCVRLDDVVGYVNDEGLLIGLTPNVFASALFGQPLVGDCVVVGSLNESGEYDGENHDVPDFLCHPKVALLARLMTNNEAISELVARKVANIDLTPSIKTFTNKEFQAWLNNEWLNDERKEG